MFDGEKQWEGSRNQDQIESRWGAQLELATERLCLACRWQTRAYLHTRCTHALLPLTTDGSDCPYYSPGLPLLPSSDNPGTAHGEPVEP